MVTQPEVPAGIWTRDISNAHRLARQLKAGGVWINCCKEFHAAMPTGGYKQSGWCRELGEVALDLCVQTEAVNVQL